MSLQTNAPANLALKQIFSGVDKLKAMGFKKKDIIKMISAHMGRRKSKSTAERLRAGLQALAGE
jgi:Holliday junction resolvasome RuvABC DNA-binding subunit